MFGKFINFIDTLFGKCIRIIVVDSNNGVPSAGLKIDFIRCIIPVVGHK